MAAEQNTADQVKEETKIETKGQMTQRHKREVKELQNKIGGLNRTVSKNDKEGRKKLQLEIKKLEDDLKARHENEIKAFEARQKEQESQVQTGIQNLTLNNNTEENKTEEQTHEGEKPTDSTNMENDQNAEAEETAEADDDAFTINIPGNNKSNNNNKVSRAKKRKAAKAAQDKERQQKIEDAKKNTVSQREVESQRLKEILAPLKLVIREISADGNCLYNAVADQLRRLKRGDFFNNEYLRNQVADYMMANKYDFLPFMDISEGEFDNYCNKIRTTSAWGGQLEIQALTNILKTPIEIYSATSPVVRMGEDFNEEKPLLLSPISMKRGIDRIELVEESDRATKMRRRLNESDIFYINNLVDDVMKLILSFLDETSRKHARLACTKWFNMINFSVFNIGAILPSEIEQVVRVFGRYKNQIELHFKRVRFPKPATWGTVIPEQLSKLTNLCALTSNWCHESMTNLTSLETGTLSDQPLKLLTQLKRLVVDDIKFNSELHSQLLPQLEELSIHGHDNLGHDIVTFFPNLKHLTLFKTKNSANKKWTDIFKSLTKLESIAVDKQHVSWDQLSTSLTRVIVSPLFVPSPKFDSTKLTNLRHLHIQNDLSNLSLFPFLESLSFKVIDDLRPTITALSRLTSLTIGNLTMTTLTSLNWISTLTKLRALEICHQGGRNNFLKMKSLRNMVNLTSLSVPFSSQIIGTWKRMTALQSLRIWLTDQKTDFFRQLTNLTSLHIRSTYGHIKYQLSTLTRLLDLSVDVENNFAGIYSLTRLTSLMYSIVDNDNPNNWNMISNLTNLLEYTELQGFKSWDPDRLSNLEPLTRLTHLNIGSKRAYNLEHLTKLSKLQALFLVVPRDLTAAQEDIARTITVTAFPYLVEYSIRTQS